MDNRLIICYMDNDTKEFTIISETIEQWKQANPNCNLMFAFHITDEILSQQEDNATIFVTQCRNYGLLPQDLNRKFKNKQGHIMQLTGLLPRNKKYKCRVFDCTDNKTYKVSPDYVIHGLTTAPIDS